MKKITLLLLTTFIGHSISAYATENITEAANQFYKEQLEQIVRERTMPISDKNIQDAVIERVLSSDSMKRWIDKTYPCLSQISEDKWENIGAQKCLGLSDRTIVPPIDSPLNPIHVGEAITGKKVGDNAISQDTFNDFQYVLNTGIRTLKNNSQTLDYAYEINKKVNTLLSNRVIADLNFKNQKLACGATLDVIEKGLVAVNFPDKCIDMKSTDSEYGITVDGIIKGIEHINKSGISFTDVACETQRCIFSSKLPRF